MVSTLKQLVFKVFQGERNGERYFVRAGFPADDRHARNTQLPCKFLLGESQAGARMLQFTR